MRVDKVILHAALSTLAAILILFGFMIFALCYIYPSTMMNIAYDLGMDGASITCAKRSYDRSDDIYYIAFATELAISSEDTEEIAECGASLIADDEFAAYCAERNANVSAEVSGTYEQYVYGQVCVARYALGSKEDAVAFAFEGIGNGFPQNNAVVAVLLTALSDNDSATVISIKVKMRDMQTESFSETERAYYEKMLTFAENG